jgi:hypothetical protein
LQGVLLQTRHNCRKILILRFVGIERQQIDRYSFCGPEQTISTEDTAMTYLWEQRLGLTSAVLALATAASIVCLPRTSVADEGGVSFWLPGLFGSLAAAPQQGRLQQSIITQM